ncbi:hypothetical protein [Tsuneonella suprasediminis]|uniref:hypothetical protein n=1 Tax=Tsuneonella suprasediminis TaxID=2306996 RepID=UPI001CD80B96|nr:hypothetical protein LBX01_09260 [Altererythrobacter sp. N1]
MMVNGSRLRQIGWAVTLAICFSAFMALTFKVNSVKSEVRLAERRIVSLQQEKTILETEFETRASQHQLAQWNAVDFGYEPPRADQYLESERQLAALGEVPSHNAPSPIRVAQAPEAGRVMKYPEMVSPLTGKPVHNRVESGALAAALAQGGELLAEGGR